MAVSISPPRTDSEGLVDLAPLWKDLHRHHRDVSDYAALVRDVDSSWASRLRLYRRLLAEGASYLTATDEDGQIIGYAMVAVDEGPDDTFDIRGGTVEVVTLVVTGDQRSGGVGRALLSAAERIARDRGFDTVKIAMMSGNDRARKFYEANGYEVVEHVLYRRLD
ncbi:MAG TPA: GNAT family N-acetyltransferase [Solirubrobacteraceae bacterium]|nr:GNAT family N-acetyltransferase [Solirubrobacteraceae bacterium]